jgi:hypothetical protein
MKTLKKIFKIAAIMLILAVGFYSCAKEGDTSFREITIKSEIPVPNDTVINGIEFKFCLLNEDGEPSTVFNVGENFGFYFKCTNLDVNNEVEYDCSFLNDLLRDGFCNVISQRNGTIGYPCKMGNCLMKFQYYPLYGENNSYEIIVPWSDSREGWDDRLICYYESLHRKSLSMGKYYTGFTHEFEFRSRQNDGTYNDWIQYNILVSFKIDFEVRLKL